MLNQNKVLYNANNKKSYRYLTYIVSIYSFCFLLPSILLRKIIDLPHIGAIPISILFTGTYFMLLDVITEVYGYSEARKALLAGVITYTIFIFTMEIIINIPSPATYQIAWGVTQDSLAYDHNVNYNPLDFQPDEA